MPKDTIPNLVSAHLTFDQIVDMSMGINTEPPAINDIIVVGTMCGMGHVVRQEERARVTAPAYLRNLNSRTPTLMVPVKYYTGDKAGELGEEYVGDLRRATGHPGNWTCLK
jgi:hypothetical protein